MAHALDGAFAHLERADDNFGELKSLLDPFIEENQKKALADYDIVNLRGIRSFESSGVKSYALPDIPDVAPVLVSAIIHHLRAALDYLVYELALNDSGSFQDGTQFLIEDAKSYPKDRSKGFDARAKSKLRGLSPSHIAAIELLQPYNGTMWTETLRDISNSDKHRRLTVIGVSHFVSHVIKVGVLGSFDHELGTTLRSISTGQEINIQADSTVYVGFPQWNNVPVLKTLEILKGKVRIVIDSFKSEFK